MLDDDDISFKTPLEFSFYIEKLAKDLNINYVEALTNYCENHQVEPMDIAKYVNASLKEKLMADFIQMNYLPKEPSLNI